MNETNPDAAEPSSDMGATNSWIWCLFTEKLKLGSDKLFYD